MKTSDTALRGLWLAVILLAGVVAAAAGGVAIRATGATPAQALGTAFTIFVGTVTLGLAARKFLTE